MPRRSPTTTKRKAEAPPPETPAARPPCRVKQYAQDVLAGRIIAGPHVRNACRRHLDDLKNGKARGLHFDRPTAEWAIAQYETRFRLSEGQFEDRPFLLEPSQAFIVGSIFGWLRADGRRRFRRAFVEQGKGNGKSPLAAGLGLIGLMFDGEAGSQVYSAASKRDQAAILFLDAVAMVRKSPSISKRLKISGAPGREFNIGHILSSSFFRPVSRDHGKTGSGPRPYFVLADEVHEMPNRDVLETLERGFKFRRQPLLFMITNSGSDRNSVAWTEHEFAIRCAAGSQEPVDEDGSYVGDVVDDETFAYVCALDKGDDPLTDPSCWIKANPLLGVTLEHDYLAGIVKQAVQMPSKLNNILRLHFCVWTDADVAWMTRALLDPALADFDPIAEHAGKRRASAGVDLANVRDMAAVAYVVKTGTKPITVERDGEEVTLEKPTYDAWIEAWTPGDTLAARELRDKLQYSVWRDKGYLYAPKGATIPFVQVAQGLHDVNRLLGIRACGYDRYAFLRFEEDARSIGLDVPFIEHPQGGVKKGKPTEAMKKAAKEADPPREAEGLWMPGSLRHLENALLERRLRLLRNPVLVSAMLSAVTEEDKWGNRWLSKLRSVNKIDAAVALAIAIGVAEAEVDENDGFEGWLAAMREAT